MNEDKSKQTLKALIIGLALLIVGLTLIVVGVVLNQNLKARLHPPKRGRTASIFSMPQSKKREKSGLTFRIQGVNCFLKRIPLS